MANITGEINPKIYESPDGGITVYARDFGEPHENRVKVTKLPVSDRDKDPLMQAIKKNSYFVDVELCREHPELQTKWEEFKDLQQHYQAWDLLNKK
jgi:hypothetical protein|tara:strand:- start:276 stop:563 length:288 start_codon:yes stop_codon:yes gene_type:complete